MFRYFLLLNDNTIFPANSIMSEMLLAAMKRRLHWTERKKVKVREVFEKDFERSEWNYYMVTFNPRHGSPWLQVGFQRRTSTSF